MTRHVVAVVILAFALATPAAEVAQAQGTDSTIGKSGGYTYRVDTLSVQPQDENGANVPCVNDQDVVGGGAKLEGGPEASFIGTLSSQFNPGWTVRAWDGTGTGWDADIFAICKKIPLSDQSGGSADHGVDPGPNTETETARCETGRMLGGGGFFAGNHVDQWYLNSTFPKGKGWTWTGWHYESTGASEIAANVICEKGARTEVETETKKSAKEHVKVKVGCRKGVVTSGGGSASKSARNAHLVKTVPFDDGDQGLVPDDGWAVEWENDGIVKQEFVAYAVCD